MHVAKKLNPRGYRKEFIPVQNMECESKYKDKIGDPEIGEELLWSLGTTRWGKWRKTTAELGVNQAGKLGAF